MSPDQTGRPTGEVSQVVDDAGARRFEILVDGEVAGYAEYHTNGTKRAFTHTVVEPRFEGHGLGSLLARGALEATRRAGLQVLPYCPFIRGYIEQHPDLLDLVPPDRRAEFDLPAAG